MENPAKRKRPEDSPPSASNKASRVGDLDASKVKSPRRRYKRFVTYKNKFNAGTNGFRQPNVSGANTTPLADRGRNPLQTARTDGNSPRSPNPFSVGEIGVNSPTNGEDTTPAQSRDPRIVRRQAASKLQNESTLPTPVANATGGTRAISPSLSDDQRTMQILSNLETDLMAKRLQIQSVRSKLRNKKVEFEKCLTYFEKFPEFRKKRENEIKALQEELDQLDRARQKLESDIAIERDKFSYAVAILRDKAGAQDDSRNPQELLSVQQEMKALQDEVKTLKDLLNARNDEWSQRTKTLEDGLANQQNVINDITASKIGELASALQKDVQNTETKLLQTMEEHSDSTTSEIDKLRTGIEQLTGDVEEQQGKDKALEECFQGRNTFETETKATLEGMKQNHDNLAKKVETHHAAINETTKLVVNENTRWAKSLQEVRTRLDTLESAIASKSTSASLKEMLDTIRDMSNSISAISKAVDIANTRMQNVEASLAAKAEKATLDSLRADHKATVERANKLQTAITDLRTTIDGNGNTDPGLVSSNAAIEASLNDNLAKYQQFYDQLMDKDIGELSTLKRTVDVIRAQFMEIKVKHSGPASRPAITTSSSRATSQDVGSPGISNGTLQQGSVADQISAAIKPLADSLQAQKTEVQNFASDLKRTMAGLGMEYIRHADGSTTLQSDGENSNDIHFAHIPQAKVEEIEQRLFIMSSAVQDLTRQHQNLTTAEMSKKMVDMVRNMYPDIFPATKKEIENIQSQIQVLHASLSRTDAGARQGANEAVKAVQEVERIAGELASVKEMFRTLERTVGDIAKDASKSSGDDPAAGSREALVAHDERSEANKLTLLNQSTGVGSGRQEHAWS